MVVDDAAVVVDHSGPVVPPDFDDLIGEVVVEGGDPLGDVDQIVLSDRPQTAP